MSIKLATNSFERSYSFLYSKLYNIDNKNINKIAKASIMIGKAMNITRTTAPHVFSYPLTAYLDIPHGLAVSLMMKNCILQNLKSIQYSKKLYIFKKIFQNDDIYQISKSYLAILNFLNVDRRLKLDNKMINKFIKEINFDRLKNNPVEFNKIEIKKIYQKL